jgi:hypothetical protein
MTNEQRQIKLHDAHVKEWLRWLRILHDAHVQEWRKWHGTPKRVADVLASEAAPAFSEYHLLRKTREEEVSREKEQREQARKALQQIQKQIALAKKNPVLARALIAAFTGTPHESWRKGSSRAPRESTEEEHEAAVQREAAFSQAVERMAHTIDALAMPRNPGGHPAEPELDRLILRLSEIVVRAGFGQTEPHGIAIIEELMHCGRVPRAAYSIAARLAALTDHHYLTIPLTPAQIDALERVTAARQDSVTGP